MSDLPEPSGRALAAELQQHGAKTRVYAALLIVAIATLSAVATWRAEIAGTKAAALQHQAVVDSIGAASSEEQAYATAAQGADWYQEVQQLVADSTNAYQLARDALPAEEPGRAAAALDESYAALWALDSEIGTNFYLGSSGGSADLTRYEVEAAARAYYDETHVSDHSETYLHQAERQEAKRTHLLIAALVLVASLIFATYGQLTRRLRLARIWLVAGTVGLAVAGVAMLVIEA